MYGFNMHNPRAAGTIVWRRRRKGGEHHKIEILMGTIRKEGPQRGRTTICFSTHARPEDGTLERTAERALSRKVHGKLKFKKPKLLRIFGPQVFPYRLKDQRRREIIRADDSPITLRTSNEVYFRECIEGSPEDTDEIGNIRFVDADEALAQGNTLTLDQLRMLVEVLGMLKYVN